MAPQTIVRKRFVTAQFDLDPKDSETGAVQAPEWQGIGGEDGEEERSSNSSGDESANVILDKKERATLPRDAEEEELERIVFGDSAGFREGIDAFSLPISAAAYDDNPEDDDDDDDRDYANKADQDLFFFDAGPVIQAGGDISIPKAGDFEDEDEKPAWEDSDDERLVVSLASVPQLRKLRETAEDDMVNGKEYVRRLQHQFERLYPTPDWAAHATGKARRKRRSVADDESDAQSASDMEVDEDDLSTQPLARLLKDADILSRSSNSSVKRRRLQAGSVEIVRLKDVSGAGPVCVFHLFEMWTDEEHTVCNNVSVVPSHISTSPVIWSQFDAFLAPCQPKSSGSKPAPHIFTYQTHTAYHDCFPSISFRFTYFPQRSATLFPCLGSDNRCCGESVSGVWSSARTTDNGKLRVITKRQVHGLKRII